MREILFRGIDEGTNEWVYGYYYENPDYYCGDKRYYIFDDKTTSKYNVLHETVGQYTGLNDKNGKKIFEGDIIKSCEYDEVYCVKYFADDNYPAFDVVPEMNITCNGLSHLHIVEGIEVIGNIHDNPELLDVVRK